MSLVLPNLVDDNDPRVQDSLTYARIHHILQELLPLLRSDDSSLVEIIKQSEKLSKVKECLAEVSTIDDKLLDYFALPSLVVIKRTSWNISCPNTQSASWKRTELAAQCLSTIINVIDEETLLSKLQWLRVTLNALPKAPLSREITALDHGYACAISLFKVLQKTPVVESDDWVGVSVEVCLTGITAGDKALRTHALKAWERCLLLSPERSTIWRQALPLCAVHLSKSYRTFGNPCSLKVLAQMLEICLPDPQKPKTTIELIQSWQLNQDDSASPSNDPEDPFWIKCKTHLPPVLSTLTPSSSELCRVLVKKRSLSPELSTKVWECLLLEQGPDSLPGPSHDVLDRWQSLWRDQQWDLAQAYLSWIRESNKDRMAFESALPWLDLLPIVWGATESKALVTAVDTTITSPWKKETQILLTELGSTMGTKTIVQWLDTALLQRSVSRIQTQWIATGLLQSCSKLSLKAAAALLSIITSDWKQVDVRESGMALSVTIVSKVSAKRKLLPLLLPQLVEHQAVNALRKLADDFNYSSPTLLLRDSMELLQSHVRARIPTALPLAVNTLTALVRVLVVVGDNENEKSGYMNGHLVPMVKSILEAFDDQTPFLRTKVDGTMAFVELFRAIIHYQLRRYHIQDGCNSKQSSYEEKEPWKQLLRGFRKEVSDHLHEIIPTESKKYDVSLDETNLVAALLDRCRLLLRHSQLVVQVECCGVIKLGFLFLGWVSRHSVTHEDELNGASTAVLRQAAAQWDGIANRLHELSRINSTTTLTIQKTESCSITGPERVLWAHLLDVVTAMTEATNDDFLESRFRQSVWPILHRSLTASPSSRDRRPDPAGEIEVFHGYLSQPRVTCVDSSHARLTQATWNCLRRCFAHHGASISDLVQKSAAVLFRTLERHQSAAVQEEMQATLRTLVSLDADAMYCLVLESPGPCPLLTSETSPSSTKIRREYERLWRLVEAQPEQALD